MSFLLDKVYPLLPVTFQNVAISAFGYKWHKRRFGGVFEEELKKFKDRESYSEQQWRDYQTSELRKLLIHAIETVPYYRELFKSKGFSKEAFSKFELEDLAKLPVIEKDTLRQKGTTELLSEKLEAGGIFLPSSGSTGTPTNTFTSKIMHQRVTAANEARARNWAGLTHLNPRGMVGGRRVIKDGQSKPPYYRYNFIEKQVYFSPYHLSRNTAANYLEGIKRYDVDYMVGYATSNFVMARFFDELNLEAPQLTAVLSSSEKLTQEMRDTYQKVYGCKTYDGYSSVEASVIISECEHGNMHVSPDVGIVEFLNEAGEPAKVGEMAEIVCTGLLNFNQPLIRYRIKDLAILSDEKCACGREMQVVKEIVGRIEDLVIGRDGREFAYFYNVFVNLPNIIEGQVVQNDYEDFELNVASQNGLSEAEKETMIKRMESQLGEINVKINEVASIPRTKNGKFKTVVSKVKRK